MDTETKVMTLLGNEPSEPLEVEGYDCRVVFKRPPLAGKHRGKAWAFRKMKEYGYDPTDENSGTLVIQYWGQLNQFVVKVLEGKKEYPFDPKADSEYSCVFEKYVVEEIYNRGKSEEAFITELIIMLARWMGEGEVADGDLKNS